RAAAPYRRRTGTPAGAAGSDHDRRGAAGPRVRVVGPALLVAAAPCLREALVRLPRVDANRTGPPGLLAPARALVLLVFALRSKRRPSRSIYVLVVERFHLIWWCLKRD